MPKAKRRILSVARSYVVGMNRRLAHEIARAGGDEWELVAVAPLSFRSSKELRPVAYSAMPDEPVRVEAIPFHFDRSVHVCHYSWKLRSIMREGWDIVHCWEEPYVFVGGQVHWLTPKGTPVVFWTAQNLNKNYPPPFSWIERYCLKRCSGWMACGQSIVDTLLPRGYDKRPYKIMPLGVDTGYFKPDAAARAATHQKLGWVEEGPPVVGYLGRFVADKGVKLLMEALEGVKAPWRAMFVGAGPMEAEIRAWGEKFGDRVRVCSDVGHSAVPAYLNGMDILCAPSQTMPAWREQFGRMLVEGFASGLAVLGSDSGEIPFVVGDAGLVIGEKDLEGWQKALGELLENPAKRKELSQKGRARAMEQYAWPVIARSYLSYFEETIERGVPK